MALLNEALRGLGTLFDAIPKSKWQKVGAHGEAVEVGLRRSAMLLNAIRNYFLEETGEKSPFVGAIDELVDRQKGG